MRNYVAGVRPVHILVNSAAVMWPPRQRTAEGLESHPAMNHSVADAEFLHRALQVRFDGPARQPQSFRDLSV